MNLLFPQLIREALKSFTCQGEVIATDRLGKGKAKDISEPGATGTGKTEAAHALWTHLGSEWAGH